MIPIFRPTINKEGIKKVVNTLRSGWWGKGPVVELFEKKIKKFIDAKYVVSVNSGTAAIHLALLSLNLPKGSEVIIPSMTFIATALPVLYCGLKPVFVDVKKETLNIDFDELERKIGSKTKAIIIVHFGGNPVNIEKLKRIKKKYGVFIIEDCAHAMGSYYKGKHVGVFGDFGCFSFNAVKNLPVGDGGLIVVNNQKRYEWLKKARFFSLDKDTYSRIGSSYTWEYDIKEVGYKYYLNDILASLGLISLKSLVVNNKKRKENINLYKKLLSNNKEISFLKEEKESVSSNHLFILVLNNKNIRDGLIEYLKKAKISSGVHYKPLHTFKLFKSNKKIRVAEEMYNKIITLPNFSSLKKKEVKFICKNINDYYKLIKRN